MKLTINILVSYSFEKHVEKLCAQWNGCHEFVHLCSCQLHKPTNMFLGSRTYGTLMADLCLELYNQRLHLAPYTTLPFVIVFYPQSFI